MELFEDNEIIKDQPKQYVDDIVYKVFTTRLQEYNEKLKVNPQLYESIESPKLQSDVSSNFHISSAVLMSSVTITIGIVSMAYFKIGVLYTVLICIFVIALMVFGYANFIYPLTTTFYQTVFFEN